MDHHDERQKSERVPCTLSDPELVLTRLNSSTYVSQPWLMITRRRKYNLTRKMKENERSLKQKKGALPTKST